MDRSISRYIKMDFEDIGSKASVASDKQYWKAMDLWLNSPHLVNRRISSSINLLSVAIQCEASTMIDRLLAIGSPSEILRRLSQGESTQDALNIKDKCRWTTMTIGSLETIDNGNYLFINKLLPRDTEKFSAGIEFILVEKESRSILCFHRNINEEQRCLGLKNLYRILYDDDNKFSISVERTERDFDDPSIRWLQERLFPRLLKWIEADRSNDDALIEGSLNLVSSEKYTLLYSELKRKYGIEMVKKWPECTDPNKFVYEDVAIATYLLLLWEKERKEIGINEKQSFVDLGCGNGLLVYILTSEGHCGTGIDLRKRKIWDIYPPTTRLEERTIVPSSASLFPEVDWLIGNHSDELTPWIPVIAARSSHTCRFFLLPCCAHEFDGRKFQRESAAKSQYFEYIKYMKTVCEGCGFKTNLDKLRIPSTKRICLIGGERSYPKEKSNEQDKIVERLINARSSKGKEAAEGNNRLSESQWSRDFKPRDIVERVRNCTQIDKTIIDEIINIVTSHLLQKVRPITRKEEPEKTWNAGGQIELSEIAKIIAAETLKQLRKECGGLQTLLKNNGHIFQVLNGKVQFKVHGAEDTGNKRKKKGKTMKVKPCWFYANHPDGCPLSDELCTFKH